MIIRSHTSNTLLRPVFFPLFSAQKRHITSHHSLLVLLLSIHRSKEACHISPDGTSFCLPANSTNWIYCFKMMINVMEWETFLFFVHFLVLILFNFRRHTPSYPRMCVPICFCGSMTFCSYNHLSLFHWLTANDLLFCRKMTCAPKAVFGSNREPISCCRYFKIRRVYVSFFAFLSYWMPRGCQKNVILGTVKQINIHLFLN